jgi:hypothetical protein
VTNDAQSRLALVASPKVVVVHIVWRDFGITPFEQFIGSYVSKRSGCEHTLLLVLKGFTEEMHLEKYRHILRGVRHQALRLPSTGLDIGSYLSAAAQTEGDYFCFLNSNSVLLGDDWLEKLYAHAQRKTVGVAGATGSWQSLSSDFPQHHERAADQPSTIRRRLRTSFANHWRHRLYYPVFPNPHIRTNAFMLRRTVLDELHLKRFRTRIDTSRYESGRSSLTKLIECMNLEALVVVKNGQSYSRDDWSQSRTFWRYDQENLLIADNQTERYANAEPAERLFLTGRAWGVAP